MECVPPCIFIPLLSCDGNTNKHENDRAKYAIRARRCKPPPPAANLHYISPARLPCQWIPVWWKFATCSAWSGPANYCKHSILNLNKTTRGCHGFNWETVCTKKPTSLVESLLLYLTGVKSFWKFFRERACLYDICPYKTDILYGKWLSYKHFPVYFVHL